MRQFFRWASLVATLALTAHSEWSVGMALHLDWLSWLIPVAVDSYVMFSLLSGRDQPWALGLLWSSVVVGSIHGTTYGLTMLLGIGLGTALTLVLWRIDRILHEEIEARDFKRREDEAEQARREARAQREAALAARVTAPAPEVPAAPPVRTSREPEVPAPAVVIESVPEQRTATDEELDLIGRPIVEAGGVRRR